MVVVPKGSSDVTSAAAAHVGCCIAAAAAASDQVRPAGYQVPLMMHQQDADLPQHLVLLLVLQLDQHDKQHHLIHCPLLPLLLLLAESLAAAAAPAAAEHGGLQQMDQGVPLQLPLLLLGFAGSLRIAVCLLLSLLPLDLLQLRL